MGCDIHGWVEHYENGRWRAVNNCLDYQGKDDQGHAHDRNYERFGLLAGVRSSPANAPEPRGFPHDASPECREDYKKWEGDAHTPSYMPLPAALQIFMDTESRRPNGAAQWEDTRWTSKFPGDYFFNVPCPDDTYRIVFWFDN